MLSIKVKSKITKLLFTLCHCVVHLKCKVSVYCHCTLYITKIKNENKVEKEEKKREKKEWKIKRKKKRMEIGK